MTLLVFFLLFLAETTAAEPSSQRPHSRALFVSVIQDPPALSSRENIQQLVDFSGEAGIRTLFIQVYRANKAWFPSAVGDATPYAVCLKNVSEDPLALLIKEAHAAGIEVHAWLNLLSLGENGEAPLLKKYGPGILTKNRKEKKSLEDYKIDGQYFLEPGDTRVRKELSIVVEDLVRAYPDLDGVQFDYIRYPDKDPAYGYTEENMRRFKKAAGRESIDEESDEWKDWKLGQVTDLVEILAAKAREIRPDIQVSTTGLVPYSRASLEAFQDWRFWVKSARIDFVTLMCYSPDRRAFEKYIQDARKQIGNLEKVNIAVGAYALVDSPTEFEAQWEVCEASGSRACVVFHYGDFLKNPALAKRLVIK